MIIKQTLIRKQHSLGVEPKTIRTVTIFTTSSTTMTKLHIMIMSYNSIHTALDDHLPTILAIISLTGAPAFPGSPSLPGSPSGPYMNKKLN